MRNQAGMNEKERTRRLTVMGLLCAVAYVIVAVCRIPIVSFLKYEPKDVVIVIGGFLYGAAGVVCHQCGRVAGGDAHRQRYRVLWSAYEHPVQLRVRVHGSVRLRAPAHAEGRDLWSARGHGADDAFDASVELHHHAGVHGRARARRSCGCCRRCSCRSTRSRAG